MPTDEAVAASPVISVITVSFNSVATIGDTLTSVASQTHPLLEHIVIDGGSTDGTLRVLAQRDSHLARVVSGPDSGIYDAMNKGLRSARGDLIGFLNADDVFAGPDTLSRIAKAAAAEPCIDAVYGDLQYIAAQPAGRLLRRWRSGAYSKRRLRYGWMPPHPTFYLRRSRLASIGEFDLRFRIAADYDFMLRCLLQPDFRVAYVGEVLVRMRAGGASNRSMGALWRKSCEDLAVLHKNEVGGFPALVCKNLRKLPQFFTAFASDPAD